MPFFRQKEFLTERRRLLSSKAGKLPSSRLTISPWLRAVALEPFPAGWDAQPSPHPPQAAQHGGVWTLHGVGGQGMAQGGLCQLQRWTDQSLGMPTMCQSWGIGHASAPCPASPAVPSPARLGSHPDLPHRLWLPAQPLCLLNEEVWIFPTI